MNTLFNRVQVGKTFKYMSRSFEKIGEKRAITGRVNWVFDGKEMVEIEDETSLSKDEVEPNYIRQYLSYSDEDSD